MAMSAPFLFVIARREVERFDFVRRHFAAEPEVEVVFDRRVGQRRGLDARAPSEERRNLDRRRRDVSPDLNSLGWAYVRRAERPGLGGAPPRL